MSILELQPKVKEIHSNVKTVSAACDLKSLIIEPFQRLTRYNMILKEVQEHAQRLLLAQEQQVGPDEEKAAGQYSTARTLRHNYECLKNAMPASLCSMQLFVLLLSSRYLFFVANCDAYTKNVNWPRGWGGTAANPAAMEYCNMAPGTVDALDQAITSVFEVGMQVSKAL